VDEVTLELYGIARRRAGTDAVRVPAGTLSEALCALERACPALAGEVVRDGRLAPHWRASLDGKRFLDGPDSALPAGSRVLILSGLAGG
jgi:molybdopterin converting factor small subunit